MDLFERIQLVSAVATYWGGASYLLNRWDPDLHDWCWAPVSGAIVTFVSAAVAFFLACVFYWVATGHALV